VGRQLIFECNYTFDAIFTETNITKLANFEIGKQTQFNFFRAGNFLRDEFLTNEEKWATQLDRPLCIIPP
jgi:hypothetical protein